MNQITTWPNRTLCWLYLDVPLHMYVPWAQISSFTELFHSINKSPITYQAESELEVTLGHTMLPQGLSLAFCSLTKCQTLELHKIPYLKYNSDWILAMGEAQATGEYVYYNSTLYKYPKTRIHRPRYLV